MKNGASVSKRQLDAAVMHVQSELIDVGLWNERSRLRETEVYWCRLPQLSMPDALGFFVHGNDFWTRLSGCEPGHMYIPAWVLSHWLWQRRGSLRDVIRHEYGHGVAHYYPALIQRSERFRYAFGGRYFGDREAPVGKDEFVSEYAATSPAEDFAETFMLYVRHKGLIPPHFSRGGRPKWRFISDVCDRIDSGKAGW